MDVEFKGNDEGKKYKNIILQCFKYQAVLLVWPTGILFLELKWYGKINFFVQVLDQYQAIYQPRAIYRLVNEMKYIGEIKILLVFLFLDLNPLTRTF